MSKVLEPPALPALVPPTALRPLAFRVFTQKHNLNLSTSGLQLLASFIGNHCGAEWRKSALTEELLDEAAKQWKSRNGTVIVSGEAPSLSDLLSEIGPRFKPNQDHEEAESDRSVTSVLTKHQTDVPGQTTNPDREPETAKSIHYSGDLYESLKIINAFQQPKLLYNPDQKRFEAVRYHSSLLADREHKTALFRQRYHLIYQRLMRNRYFLTSNARAFSNNQSGIKSSDEDHRTAAFSLTSISQLLGRNRSDCLLLGLLSRSPTGSLMASDLTGSVILETDFAQPVPLDGAWFCPGMILLIEGHYDQDRSAAGSGLDGNSGVGGTINGTFIASEISGPPCEPRDRTLGLLNELGEKTDFGGAGFGWVDFLGVGSERAMSSQMKDWEDKVSNGISTAQEHEGRYRIIIIGEMDISKPNILRALRTVLSYYSSEALCHLPAAFVLMGNFIGRATVGAGGGGGASIEYKECFDALASVLIEYPILLQETKFIFVPGDNDPWGSSFSTGGPSALPRTAVPDMFTSRIRRAFATAKGERKRSTGKRSNGEAIWSSNPTRLTLFGPRNEIVLFRDDLTSRLRRNAIRLRSSRIGFSSDATVELDGQNLTVSKEPPEDRTKVAGNLEDRVLDDKATAVEVSTARQLVKALFDQGNLSPFPVPLRPLLWDYSSSLQLYPLPTALILMDPEAPTFATNLEGCHIMNPGHIFSQRHKGFAQCVEYNLVTKRSKIRELRI